jgi:Uma2 family endonuclease
MSAQPKPTAPKKMTVAEFLPWAETRTDGRYELVDGVPVRMQSERLRHVVVKGNIYFAFRNAVVLANLKCHALPDGAAVIVTENTCYEPDVVVQCRPLGDLNRLVAMDPTIVVEVLSPSSEKSDEPIKLPDYMTVQSIHHVLIVDPLKCRVVHYERQDATTFLTRLVGLNDELRFAIPGFSVRSASFFEGLDEAAGDEPAG